MIFPSLLTLCTLECQGNTRDRFLSSTSLNNTKLCVALIKQVVTLKTHLYQCTGDVLCYSCTP